MARTTQKAKWLALCLIYAPAVGVGWWNRRLQGCCRRVYTDVCTACFDSLSHCLVRSCQLRNRDNQHRKCSNLLGVFGWRWNLILENINKYCQNYGRLRKEFICRCLVTKPCILRIPTPVLVCCQMHSTNPAIQHWVFKPVSLTLQHGFTFWCNL